MTSDPEGGAETVTCRFGVGLGFGWVLVVSFFGLAKRMVLPIVVLATFARVGFLGVVVLPEI
jgi:hypothetical protein